MKTITPAMHNRTLPRADPAEVQKVLDLWKTKHGLLGPASEETRGLFRRWAYMTANHFFSPHDVFNPLSWSVEDVRMCLEALTTVGGSAQ